jgi:hypothetical protein
VASGGAVNAFHVYTFEQIAMGHLSEIRCLVKGKVSPDIVDDTNLHDSALHWACSFGNVEVGMLLLDMGGNVNIANSSSQTCLHAACRARNSDFVMMLLKYGIDISLRDSAGKLAAEYLPDDGASFSDLADIIRKHVEGYSGSPRVTDSVSSTTAAPEQLTAGSAAQKKEAVVSSSRAAVEASESVGDGGSEFERASVVSSVNDGSGYDTDTDGDSADSTSAAKSGRITASGAKYIPHDINTKKIIIWPPAQRQVQYSSQSASHPKLLLHSSSPVVISTASGGIDIYPLLTWSGLVDTFERLGLSSQVQRGATRAHVKLAINQDICPGRHRFEIRIGKNTS